MVMNSNGLVPRGQYPVVCSGRNIASAPVNDVHDFSGRAQRSSPSENEKPSSCVSRVYDGGPEPSGYTAKPSVVFLTGGFSGPKIRPHVRPGRS